MKTEKDSDLRIEALRLAVGRNPKSLADGKVVPATEVVADAEAFFAFSKAQ